MVLENRQEEGNQGGNKDSMDEAHLEGEHIKLEESEKKGDTIVKKIDATNVAKKGEIFSSRRHYSDFQ